MPARDCPQPSGRLAITASERPPDAATGAPPLRMLQLGIRWFTETAGGAARYYYHLVQALGELDIDVRGLVLGSDNAARETDGRVTAFADDGQSFISRMLAARRRTAALLGEFQPQLVASHFAMFAFPALDLLRSRPYVVHFHGPWAEEARAEGAGVLSVAYKRLIEKAVYRQADRFVVLSDAFGRVLVEDYGAAPERVRVIPGGVEVARFATGQSASDARAALGWPADRPIVLAVRRLRRRMGLTSLVAAFALIKQRIPEALLVIAGQGPLRDALIAQAAALGLDRDVLFPGFVADAELPLAYRAADVAVMPSRTLEGFGLSAVEALAAGTPVLVTPVGGMPEIVRGLDAALVLAGTEPAHLADGIAQALREPGRLPSAERCAEYARSTYDWPIIARAVRALYREVV